MQYLFLFALITISAVFGGVLRRVNRNIWLRPIERELGHTPAEDELHVPSQVRSGWEPLGRWAASAWMVAIAVVWLLGMMLWLLDVPESSREPLAGVFGTLLVSPIVVLALVFLVGQFTTHFINPSAELEACKLSRTERSTRVDLLTERLENAEATTVQNLYRRYWRASAQIETLAQRKDPSGPAGADARQEIEADLQFVLNHAASAQHLWKLADAKQAALHGMLDRATKNAAKRRARHQRRRAKKQDRSAGGGAL